MYRRGGQKSKVWLAISLKDVILMLLLFLRPKNSLYHDFCGYHQVADGLSRYCFQNSFSITEWKIR